MASSSLPKTNANGKFLLLKNYAVILCSMLDLEFYKFEDIINFFTSIFFRKFDNADET